MGIGVVVGEAFDEFRATLKMHHLWVLMAWFDVKQRYRRSLLGPFWITLNTAVLVVVLSMLWSALFKLKLEQYVPYFAIGHVFWAMVSEQIREACTGFSQFENVIRQIRLPFPTYILRILARNLIVFMHNFVIIAVVLLIFQINPGWQLPMFFLGLMIACVLLVSLSLLIAVVCARFRDLGQLVQNLLMISFYVTPIMWKIESLPQKYQWAVNYNPLAHVISLVREPLLGHSVSAESWIFASVFTMIMFVLSLFMLGKYRHRISYWV